MKTRCLYYEDAYQKEFTATVISCEEKKDGWRLVLDETAFYPEGGGQPADHGILTCQGDGPAAQVTDVHEKEGIVYHDVTAPLELGTAVKGTVDWERRFDLMQQHSGEHIVSGLIHSRFGYDNVGFHMGSDVITIDFNGELTEEDLRTVETEANRLIWQDREVEIFYPSAQELETLAYRSKKALEGDVRIVRFPGADTCACCGTHVSRTGEVGMVRLLSAVKFREGVRVEMIAGKRVLDYLNRVDAQNHQISVKLSAKPAATAAAVERLAAEAFALRGRVHLLEEQVFAAQAEKLRSRGAVLLLTQAMEPDSVRRCADGIMHTCGGPCAVFAAAAEGGFRYAVGEEGGDLRALVKEINQELEGRGGGKPFFAQGSVQAGEEAVREFFGRRGYRVETEKI